MRLLFGAMCRRAQQNSCGEAQCRADGHGFYVSPNEHTLVSLLELDVYTLLHNYFLVSCQKSSSKR